MWERVDANLFSVDLEKKKKHGTPWQRPFSSEKPWAAAKVGRVVKVRQPGRGCWRRPGAL